MRTIVFFFSMLLLIQTALSSSDDDILLTIDSNQVTKDEFLRIYKKNSNIDIQDKKTVDEYLDLFINYKLKVIEAKNLGYDTMTTFVNEMKGYTDQLAKPYLIKQSIIDQLVRETYDRMQEEVNAAHILVRIPNKGTPEDTLKAYNEALQARKKLLSGVPFEQVARSVSMDTTQKDMGQLGWFSALQMVYPFEIASYNTPVGNYSMPVRTNYGYHIVKVIDRRKSRGSVIASQIMVVIPKNATDEVKSAAKQKIDKAYKELLNGKSWNDAVLEYSEHKMSINKGGLLPALSSGKAPEDFLNLCYSLDTGEISKPFSTEYGYHIVKVKEFKPLGTFEELKPNLEQKIRNNPDFSKETDKTMFERIKQDANYKSYSQNLAPIIALVDSTIYDGKWEYNNTPELKEPLFTLGDHTYTQEDFISYFGKRRNFNKSMSIKAYIESQYLEFENSELLAYEKDMLPSKYPELRYLLEEYNDGILLFNLTEDKVWKKAIDDTTGLKNFYNSIENKYQWKERILVTQYTFSDSAYIQPLVKLAKKKAKKGLTQKQVNDKICPNDSIPCVTMSEVKYEKGDNSFADAMNWSKGTYNVILKDQKNVLLYIEDILPAGTKNLGEARGLYVADYQNFLEKKWIEELHAKYAIKVNDEVLQSIIKEESK